MLAHSLQQTSRRSGLFTAAVLLFLTPVFSQKSAKEGMVPETVNYTSFTTLGRNPEKDLPYNAPCKDCVEDLSARTEMTRFFKGTGPDKGLVYSQGGYSPINMKNASGRWVPVDARLKPVGNGLYTAKDQPTPVTIDLNAGHSSIRNIYGEARFNNRPELLWKAEDGTVQSLGKANFSNHTAGNDGVRVTDVWPGIDMEMRAIVGGIKTNFVLRNRPQQTGGRLIIRDEFRLDGGMRLKMEGTEVTIETAGGQEAFHVSSCIGYDSQAQRANGVQNFGYELSGNTLDMVIPVSTLQNPQMVYPYTIDPLVNSSNTLPQASITGSAYGAACFSNYCTYNLTVPSPANTVITDARFTFSYLATGSCWQYDGAMTFTSGSCLSPNQAGYYWFCNNIGTGTCNGTNLSIYSDVASCMPPASCAPQNVPFQMRFYRCFSNSAGCSNSCIGAASPWTMTLTGKTVEVASASVNGSGSTTICQGASATLNAAGTAGVGPYTYSWSPGGLTGASVSVSPTTTTTYTLTVTDACSQTSTANVTVNVTPSPAAPPVSSNSPVCTGQSINLGTTATGTYVWSGPNGFTSGVQNPVIPSASAANAGTYSLYVVSGGCTSLVSTQSVVVNPGPAAPATGGNSPLCEGSALNLTASGSGGSYAWTGPGGYTSSTQNPTISPATAANSGTYSVVYTVGGCSSTPATYNVVVNPTPATPAVSSNSPVCVGNPINLTTTATTGGTYAWTGPAGFTSAVQNPVIASATAANSGTYSLAVVENGCSSAVATLTVNVVNPPVTPAFTTNSPVCEGGTITLTATNYPFVSYNWTGPAGYTATGQTVSITPATTAAAGTYSLTLSAAGCTSSATVQTVVVNPAPAAPVVGGNSPVCAGSALNLTAAGSGAGTYAWTGPGGYTSTTQNPAINPATAANAGNYTAVFIAAGCTSAVANYNVVVNAIPATPAITSNSPVCVGNPINLTTTATTGGTYAWTGPAGFTSAVQNPVIASATAANSGTYSLAVVENGCSSAVATLTVNVVNPPVTPAFTTNSPVCEGGTITLTATNYPFVSYNWTGPAGYTATGQTVSITPATTAAAGTYSLTLSAAGCTSSATVQTVVVNPAPAAPVVGGNSPVCAGSALNLTAAGSGAGTYAWTGPGGYTSTTQNPAINPATAANAGNYTAVFIAAGCTSAVANYNVVVNAIPATPAITSNSPVCIGDNINLTTPTVANATYGWTGPNGFTSATQNPTITGATTAMSGTYSLTVQVGGCQSLPGTATVNVSPPLPAPGISSNSPVCAGGTLQLSTPGATATYHWSGPGGFTSTSQNPSIGNITVAQAGTYSLYLVTGTCTSGTGTTVIQIAGSPQVTYTGPSQACGSQVTLTATATVTAPATISSVNWYAPASIGSGTTLTHQFTQTAPATVNGFVVAVSNSNCADTIPFSVQLADIPVADFSTEDLCDGKNIQFHEQHDWEGNGTGTPGFLWKFPAGQTATTANPIHNFVTPGTYTVVLVAVNPAAPACKDSIAKQVTVLPVPVLDFTYISTCQEVSFTGSVVPDTLINSYQWTFDDGGTGTAINTTHTYSQQGSYNVQFKVVTAGGCTVTTSKPVQVTQAGAGVFDVNIITPNGDNKNDELDMDAILGECTDYRFVVFGRWGNVVHTQTKGTAPFTGKSETGSLLTPGVYFYSLTYGDTKKSGTITLIR